MLYQLAPQALSLGVALPTRILPAELHLYEAPLPPLGGLEEGAVTTGPGRAHLVLVSSSASLPQLAIQAPGESPRVADRIAQFRALNPALRPIATRQGPGNFAGPAYALFRVELAPRVWRELNLRFGTPEEAVENPDATWILPSTLHRAELGFGWDHGFIKAGTHGGLRPEFPGTVRVDVRGSRVEGVITIAARCGSRTPPVEINGEALGRETLRCEGSWGLRQLAFCRETPEGRVDVRIGGDPARDAPHAVNALQLRAVERCWASLNAPDASEP
jgi:hypothetical protein